MPETPNSFEEWWRDVTPNYRNDYSMELMARAAYDAGFHSLPPQEAAVPARQPYWNCPNNPEHALESYPRLLSQNMRCKVCGIAPQFTVPARQDAVGEYKMTLDDLVDKILETTAPDEINRMMREAKAISYSPMTDIVMRHDIKAHIQDYIKCHSK